MPISTTRRRSSRRTRSRSPVRAASPSSGSTSTGRRTTIVLARFLPKVAALVVGDPAAEDTDIGPLIDGDALARVLAWIDEARAAGAEILTGGDVAGGLL